MNYHELLLKLGVSSAHPGGFAATLEQLAAFPLAPGTRLLEVGCGAGRTACHLAKSGVRVTALDRDQSMLDKATERAWLEGVDIEFKLGDACDLPFSDGSFDVVWVESVSIFTDTPKALSEYARVLTPGGNLFDREMIAMSELTPQVEQEIRGFFGVERLWNESEWLVMLEAAGFSARAWNPSVLPEDLSESFRKHPDPHQHISLFAALDPEVWKAMRIYDRIMSQYRKSFGYALFIGDKL